MFQLVAMFLTCLVDTEMCLLMRLNIESSRGFPVAMHPGLLPAVGGRAGRGCLMLEFKQFTQKLPPPASWPGVGLFRSLSRTYTLAAWHVGFW